MSAFEYTAFLSPVETVLVYCPPSQEIIVYRNGQNFDAATCAVKVGDVWIFSPRFIAWKVTGAFVVDSTEVDNQYAEKKLGIYALKWSVTLRKPSLSNYSGPLNITVLTLKLPTQVVFAQRPEYYVIRDGVCIRTGGANISFPCPYECEQYFCWLHMQIPDIAGVDAIYVNSNNNLHVGGVYRRRSIYAKEKYFQRQDPVVHCLGNHRTELFWMLTKPEGVDKVSCVQKENFYANYASLEHTTNLQTVSITAELTTEIFEGYSCWIDVNEVSVIVEYFILWLEVAFFEKTDEPTDRIVDPKMNDIQLDWHFITSTPEEAEDFECQGPSGLHCSGITTTNEPGKCAIEYGPTSMQYSIRPLVSEGSFAVYVCHIRQWPFRQSVYKLSSQYEDGLPESVIETTIALALNGKSLNLNNEGSHRLLLQNVLVEDVICRKSESSISCRLLPHHLKIHWIVSSNGADAIIKTISPSEKLRFSGVFGSCNKTPLFIQIDGDQRTSHDVHILRYYRGRLDTESILRDFLQRAFIKRCDMLRAFEV
ncbi:hypothetical protein SprV_0501827900 [Sparganum proliferum]